MASEGGNEYIYIYIYTRTHEKRGEDKTGRVYFQKDQSQRMFESNFISYAETFFLQKIR
jgi:hypothetical protein